MAVPRSFSASSTASRIPLKTGFPAFIRNEIYHKNTQMC